MVLLISNRQSKYEIEEKLVQLLEKAVLTCLIYEDWDPNYEVSLSLVNDDEIKELNRIYRGKNHPTDVLSFSLVGGDLDVETIGIEKKPLGDIVISTDRAASQAKEYNHSFEIEVVSLLVHGMFHLMGYDHETEEISGDMQAREKSVLSFLDLIEK